MELKDGAVALTGIAVTLLALGFFMGGAAFYAAACLALAVVAVDLARYFRLVRDLKRNLAVSRTVSGIELLLGSAVTVSYDLEYRGRRRIPVRCVQVAGGSVSVEGSPQIIELSPGRRTLSFTVRPTRRGSHVVRGLRIVVESFLVRGTVIAGGDATVNAYLVMGLDNGGAWSRRGRLQRLQLPGSEAFQRGSGSDFSYLRDFMPGDSTRNIDWARSSRSPTPVVRDFEAEHTLPLFILIDVDASMDRGATRTELESAVEMATLVASRVLFDNERVGLACFSRTEVTSYLPPAGGKEQMSHIRNALSALKAAGGESSPRSGFPTLQEAEAVRQMFGAGASGSEIAPILKETIRQFSANVREDGFVKAMARASRSTGTSCSIVVITNLSMGVASLLSGSRVATYYGHNVAVALTPHIWYDSAEGADPEKYYDRYRQAKETISRLRSWKIAVVELSAGEKPETLLYQGRARGSRGMTRRGR